MAKDTEKNKIHFENQKIIPVDLEREMKKSYIDYAMSVIVGRALPDARDGLKPVHRRILYAMYEDHLTADRAYRKAATTVGNVLGRYHPHGDASVYDAMVRMAQWFSLRYPMIDGHGNFGSIDGDPPAAYRYTEARMSKLAAHMMTDIDKDTVDFMPNFDDNRKEPIVLPSRFPSMLVNGSTGIAVGMATNMPPHNLTEVINGICHVIDNPEAGLDEICQYIKGPDFPTGGVIMGRSGIRAAYATGRGKLKVRARTHFEEMPNNRTRQVLESYIAKGTHVVVASGRSYDSLPQEVLSVPGIDYAITSNGVVICHRPTGEKLFYSPLKPACTQQLLSLIQTHQAEFEVFLDGVPYADAAFVAHPTAYGLPDAATQYIQSTRKPVENLLSFTQEHIQELDCLDFITIDQQKRKLLSQQLEQISGIYVTSSVPHLLEISDASAGKGAALRRLAQHLDIPREQIAAFGNEENDLDMIAFAGVGVAVANSPAHVRDCANFVTGSNDEDGVADFLERYLTQQ